MNINNNLKILSWKHSAMAPSDSVLATAAIRRIAEISVFVQGTPTLVNHWGRESGAATIIVTS